MTVQTSAPLTAGLEQILHGAFTGMIEGHCEQGILVRWEIQETFKSGRVLGPPASPDARKPELVAGEVEALLRDGFTGRLVLHCNDGSVVRYVRHRTVVPGDLIAVAPGAGRPPSGAKRTKALS